MALLVAWVSLGACTLLGVACVLLYLDNRGRRGAERAALRALRVLQAQVALQEEQLGTLRRAVAGLAPPEPAQPRSVVLPRPPRAEPITRCHTLTLPVLAPVSEDEHRTLMAPEPEPAPSSRRGARSTMLGGFVQVEEGRASG